MEEGDLIYVPPNGSKDTKSYDSEFTDGGKSIVGHIGILANDKGSLKVCEAYGTGIFSGQVQLREINDFVNDPSYKIVDLYSVTVDDSKKKEAARYAQDRLGKPYRLFSYPYNKDTGVWYCSKLVYLAYLSVGVEFQVELPLGLILPGSLVNQELNPSFVKKNTRLKPRD